MRALSETTTLIRYDQRGNGLSDRDVGNLAFEAMVEDLESVVDAAQLDRFTLLGVSQSCAVSAAYAALHPERLTGLILYGGFVRGWRKRGSPEILRSDDNSYPRGWAEDNAAFRQLFTTMFIPGANAIKPPGLTICSGSPSPPSGEQTSRSVWAHIVSRVLPDLI
jgi:pimeloyl-ACP methyl ester carboxylesterase